MGAGVGAGVLTTTVAISVATRGGWPGTPVSPVTVPTLTVVPEVTVTTALHVVLPPGAKVVTGQVTAKSSEVSPGVPLSSIN